MNKEEINRISEIDYLFKDMRNWQNSAEYKKAVKENRLIV